MSAFDSGWGSGGLFGSTPPDGVPDSFLNNFNQNRIPPRRKPLSRSAGEYPDDFDFHPQSNRSNHNYNPSEYSFAKTESLKIAGRNFQTYTPRRRRVNARPAPKSDYESNDGRHLSRSPHLDLYSDDDFGGGKGRGGGRSGSSPSLFDDDSFVDDRMYKKPPPDANREASNDDLDGMPSVGRFQSNKRSDDDEEENLPVPKIFADYFEGKHATRAAFQKNLRESAKARKKRRVIHAAGITSGVSLVAVIAAVCVNLFVTLNPFDVTMPFAKLDDNDVYAIVEPEVNRALQGRRFSLAVQEEDPQNVSDTDSNNSKDNNKKDKTDEEIPSKSDVSSADVSVLDVSGTDMNSNQSDEPGFTLAEFEFSVAAPGTSDKQATDITDEKGKITETHIFVKHGSFVYNETLVKQFLGHIAKERKGVPMIEPRYEIDGEELIVFEGKDGFGISYSTFISKLFAAIESDQTAVSVKMENLTAPAVNADILYSEVRREVADAKKVDYPDGTSKFTPDVVGIDFDLGQAREILSTGGAPWKIPLKITQPAMTLKKLRANDCPDLLAEYSTKFDPGNAGRVNNLTLAAKAISGKILAPQEQISFNDTVGERTEARGFAKATTYSESGTLEDYGGGICQISSTLYYTFIKANLKIVERHNHMYTVHYMPAGFDATVDWGRLDLKLENDKEYPIRVEFIIKGGVVTCQIWGTYDGYTADFGTPHEVAGSYKNYGIKYRKQTSPPKPDVKGQVGLTVEVYRIVYKDGEKISPNKLESTDTYKPLDNIKYVTEDQLPKGAKFSQ